MNAFKLNDKTRPVRRLSRVLAGTALTVLLAGGFLGLIGKQAPSPDLIVHEWGTFTSVAGNDGEAVEWTPWRGSTDLPEFVQHIGDPGLKSGLQGTVRMETPVIYFYTPHETTVSVKVSMYKGILTEWYPQASQVRPKEAIRRASLGGADADGSIAWNDVTVSPTIAGDFPRANAASHYYAARETSAAPVRVKSRSGEQQEKFLFYRGVSAMPLPISAKLPGGAQVLVRNLGSDAIPAVILFERRGEKVGYRSIGEIKDETTVGFPALDGTVDALCSQLEGLLAERGLYPDEAHAMVETWRDSWFEEGSRLIYIVPREFVDRVLPLTIRPEPEEKVRVFVGRMELVTPATEKAVEAAIAADDNVTLAKYGRFLEPILRTAKERGSLPEGMNY
jgi:hypothetical protein